MVYVTPGHPVEDGAGYNCHCGECLYQRALRGEGGQSNNVTKETPVIVGNPE